MRSSPYAWPARGPRRSWGADDYAGALTAFEYVATRAGDAEQRKEAAFLVLSVACGRCLGLVELRNRYTECREAAQRYKPLQDYERAWQERLL